MLGEMTTVKFVATADGGGRPNIAPILTLCHYKDDFLAFGDFLMVKTKDNLLENVRISILIMNEKLDYFTIKGTFEGFKTSGEAFGFVNSSPLIKYNAYTGIRSAGLVRAELVSPVQSISKLKVVVQMLPGVIPGRTMGINSVVGEKFERVKALKALAFLDEGHPVAIPVSIVRISGNTMYFRTDGCPTGASGAMAVITADPVTYQVKGVLSCEKGNCSLRVEEIYSGGPPLPGRRIPLNI